MRKNQKGFTLIELMIVVAIIGILAAVAIPKFAQMLEKSREGATKGNIGALKSAISIYAGDWQGVFPAYLTNVDQTGAAVPTPEGWFVASNNIAAGSKTYMDVIPAVKVTGKNGNNTTVYNPTGNGVTSGAFGTSITVSTTGWLYESATGYIWVNNDELDSFGVSYTMFGYQ
jgi:prepilin-type N-terminal cleavage/methylation domain-containing protein